VVELDGLLDLLVAEQLGKRRDLPSAAHDVAVL
jgi:hypothetical protein